VTCWGLDDLVGSGATQLSGRNSAKVWADWFGLNRNISWLTISSMVGTFGGSLYSFFLPVYFLTLGASVPVAGLVFALGIVSSSAGSFWAGSIADSWGRKPVLIAANLANASLLATLSVIRVLPLAAFCYVAISLSVGAAYPARTALLADSVSDKLRTAAYATWMSLSGVPAAIGPLVGGLLWGRYGFSLLLEVAAAFVAAMTIIRWALISEPTRQRTEANETKGGLMSGVATLRSSRVLLVLTVVGFVTAAFSAMATFVAPIFAIKTLALSTNQVGALFTSLTLALAVTPIIGAKVAQRWGPLAAIVGAGMASTVPELAFAWASSFTVAIASFAIWSGLDGIEGPPFTSWFLTATPPARRASTQGAYNALTQLMSIPFPLVGGFLFTFAPDLPFYADIAATLLVLSVLWRFGRFPRIAVTADGTSAK
jgi:MFS family permease